MTYIEQYNDKIQSNEILASKKLKAVYRHVVDNMHNDKLQYKYDDKLACKAIDFIESFIYITDTKTNQKKLLKLELWQKALISCIFGFVDKKSGMRQYREVFLYIGRKNGKSILGAAIAIYVFLTQMDADPELYCAATDSKQAGIVWRYAKIMINKNKALRKYIKCMAHSIVPSSKNHFGKFETLSKNSGSLDGLNVSALFLDELHAIKDRNMYDVLVGGMYSQPQPLAVIMSTGGYVEQDSIFDSKYQEYENIIRGYSDKKFVDETTLAIIYELDDKNEIHEEKNWIKANPNLGVSKSNEMFRQEYNKATLDERKLRDLLVKQFNFRENAKDTFFSLSDIRNEQQFNLKTFDGAYYIGGIDLSETTDLTCATALITKPADDRIYIEQMYWIPADTLESHIQKDKVPYDIWLDSGFLRTCEGGIIQQKDIVNWFLELQEKGLYLYKLGYDRWNAQYLIKDLEVNFGKSMCIPVSQGFKDISTQMYESKAWFKAKRIVYNNNPIFEWCCANVQAATDISGNIKPYKNRNTNKRIDGYSSFLDAFCVYLDNKEDL